MPGVAPGVRLRDAHGVVHSRGVYREVRGFVPVHGLMGARVDYVPGSTTVQGCPLFFGPGVPTSEVTTCLECLAAGDDA